MVAHTSFLEAPPTKVTKQFLYVVYGDNPNYHIETKLSILSLLRHSQALNFSIRVMTDQVEQYQGWPIDVLALTPTLLQEWLGPTNHHYRRKMMGVLKALDYAEQTLYVDTDTIFKKDPHQFFALMAENSVVVDQIEGRWGSVKTDKDNVKIATYLDRVYPEFGESLMVVNSGVLGFYIKDKPLLERGLAFIDELYTVDPDYRLIEQLSFALILHKQRQLLEHDHIVYHYFTKKEFFHEMGKDFFARYGQAYEPELIEKSGEMPEEPIRLSGIRRFLCRLKVRAYPKKLHSGLLKLLHALYLQQNGYEADHVAAYWAQAMRKDFSKYDPEAFKLFQKGQWPTAYVNIG